MSATHRFESLLVRGIAAAARAGSWRQAVRMGERIGGLVETLGIRRSVALGNLAIAFPEWSLEQRLEILRAHYRELGRVACEYARLPELVAAADGEVIAEFGGQEHMEAVRRRGKGALFVTGHLGNFELLGARVGRDHPISFLVRKLSNPQVETWITELRRKAGVGVIPVGSGVRQIYQALRENQWVAVAADQDAGRRGLFVPFFGRLSSTAPGPAELSLRTGAPIVMAVTTRREDLRHEMRLMPPLWPEGGSTPESVRALTARQAAVLEGWVREHPAEWFWLHRRWKTAPPRGSV